ncbi:beta strand repeat-containing protein [Larkinella sp. VNQ87]
MATKVDLGFLAGLGGQILRGPDGKIYTASHELGTLGVINNPNVGGLGANFVPIGFTLAPGTTSSYGMPQMAFGCAQPAARFDFLCSTNPATSSNTFVANGVSGQTGTITIPISVSVAGSIAITAVGTGFTTTPAPYVTTVAAGQTSITMPVTFDGSGAAGPRSLTLSSPQTTGTCSTTGGSTCTVPVIVQCVTITNNSADNTNPTICGGIDGSIKICGLVPNSGGHTISYDRNSVAQPALAGQTADASGCLILPNLTVGTYTNIRVTNPTCTSGTNSLGPIVLTNPTPPPAPTASATSLTTCSGDQVVINYTTNPVGQQVQWTLQSSTTTTTGLGNVSDYLSATGTSPQTYTYTASVTAFGCPSATTTTIVTVNPRPVITPSVCSQTICNGETGNIIFEPTIAGTTIHWLRVEDNVSGTGDISTIFNTAGTYTYKVWGISPAPATCPTSTTITCIIVVNACCPPPITRATVSLCNNETLNLQTYVPSGGSFTVLTGPAIALSGTTFNGIVSGAGVFKVGYKASGVAANCAPDTITVVVRDCTPPLCNYPINAIAVGATCGNSDGRAEVTLGGAPTSAFTSFAWSTGQIGSAISGLAAGIYSLTATVTDGINICMVIDTVSISNIGAPVMELVGVTPATCQSSGVASLTVVKGTGPFTISWTGAATGSLPPVNLGPVNVPNLPAGPYEFRITSAATPGCFGTLSVNIPRNDDGRITLTATATDATSCSSATGSIQVDVLPAVGVSAPFSYSLNGLFMASSLLPTHTFTNLPAGVYTVAVSSSTGCTTSPEVVVINVTGVSSVTGWTAQSPACPTDQARLVYAGGQPGTTFRVREAFTGAVVANSVNGANPTSLVLSAGTYIVQTTSGTCVSADTLVLNRPQDIDFEVHFTPETCAAGGVGNGDGSLSVIKITGGTDPFTIVVTNNEGQTIAPANFNALPAGNYSVNVTDANGCSGSEGTLVTVPPCGIVCPKLDFNTVVVDTKCDVVTGEATAQLLNAPTGAGTAVTYVWSNGFIGTTASNLTSGVYSVTAQITSSDIYNGCMYVDTVNVNAIDGPVFTVSPLSPASCTAANGSAVVNIQSGTAPFTISWSGPTANSTSVPNAGSITINGLKTGNYVFTVTGANSTCQGVFDVYLPGNSGNLVATASSSAVTGCGATDGQIFVNVSGGVGPFAYIVNGFVKGVTSDRNFPITGLPAGTYYVQVTDANGCTTIRENVLINTVGQPPITGITHTNPTCPEENGTIAFNGSGVASDQYVVTVAGTATQIGQTAGNVPASYSVPGGNYLITRTTSSSCVSTTVISVTQPAGLDFNIQPHNPTCALPASGSLAVIQPSGGTAPPYAYTITGATGVVSNLATASNLTAGSYTVTIGDTRGCSFSKVVTLTGGANFTVTASTGTNPVCIGTANVTLTATVSPAGSYTYAWSGPNGFAVSNTTGTASFSATSTSQSGSYTVVVTDAQGCSVTATTTPVSVTNCCSLTATASSNSPQCTGNDLQLTASVQSGSGNYTYSWTGPNGFTSTQQNPTIATSTSAASGSYTLVVTDISVPNCSFTATTDVTIATAPSLTVTSSGGLTVCSGQPASLTVGGDNGAAVTWTNDLGQSGSGTTIDFAGLVNVSGVPQTVTYLIKAQAGICSDDELVTITINPAPALQVSPTQAVICAPEVVNLRATAFPSSATVTWSRDVPNPAPSSGSNPGSVHLEHPLPVGTYNYTFQAVGTNGCTSPAKVVQVVVND